MEKITEWIWDNPMTDTRQNDSYWYDDGKLIVVRDDQKPEDSKEIMDVTDFVMPSYGARGYKSLRKQSQIVYDFCKAKGF